MVIIALSSLNPVILNYNLDQNLSLKAQTIYFTNGFTLYSVDLLQNYVDVSINKDNLLFITDNKQFQNAVDITGNDILNLQDYISSTTIQVSAGGFWDVNEGVLGADDNILIQTQDLFFIRLTLSGFISATNNSDTLEFFINFANNYVTIHDAFNQYLTFDPNTFSISFSGQLIHDLNNLQHFTYLLDGSNIMLFTAVPSLSGNERTVYYNTNVGLLSTGLAISITNPITHNHIFILNDFKDSGLNNFDAVQSNWIVYDRKDQSLNIDTAKSVLNTKHNLLISTPFKTLTENGELNININNLKNYQTPEYGYILDDANGPYGRTYNKIITGVNQDEGYDNIYLSFNSGTQATPFKKDVFTYFHFAPTAISQPLSSSTLIKSGANANKTPWRSDKIFKKQADYKKYSNWGNSTIQDGVFFCAWLSGSQNPEVVPVWIDRYFNPAYISLSGTSINAVLTALSNNLLMDITNPVIIDIPSKMIFEPGVLYTYHHTGELRTIDIINNLKDSKNLLLDFTQWGLKNSSVILDQSGNGFNGNIFNAVLSSLSQTKLDNIKNNGFNVNGAYANVEKIDNIFLNDELTFSFYLNVDDWENIIGDQILGNYYNGGIGLFNNNTILTPYITLYDPIGAYVFHSNTTFNVLNKSNFIPLGNTRVRSIIRTNYDENFHILDTLQNILSYDSENVLQNVISLKTLIPGISATQFDIDSDYIFHIMDSIAGKYYRVSSAGAFLGSNNISVGNMFAIDYNNIARFPIVNGVVSTVINSQGDFYYATNSYLYRNDIIIWQASAIDNILCDESDNIWISYSHNKIAKLDNINSLSFSLTTPITSNSLGQRSLSFYKELTPTGINSFVFLFDNRTQYAYKISTTGAILTTTPTSAFTGSLIPLVGKSLVGVSNNGFDFQRKYVMPNLIVPGISIKTFLGNQYLNGKSQKIKLQASTKGMYGTKHFAITFNFGNGTIKLYIDGDLVVSQNFNPFTYKIAANQNALSFVFGTNSSKRDVLINDLVQPKYYTFNGIIGDFKIYSNELDVWDIKALKDFSKLKAYDTLTWNMPIGNRNYIEEIERFFKHKMPGNKSQFFNIKLSGLSITDTNTRSLIEDSIKNVLIRINPVHAVLYKIIWE